MAAKKKKATARLAFTMGKPRKIEGRKEKLYTVAVSKKGFRLEIGEFLARSEADAKKQARTKLRKELG